MTLNKICNKCHKLGNAERDFFKNKGYTKDGYKSICKICSRNTNRLYQINNPKKYKEIHRLKRLKNLEHYKQKAIESARDRRNKFPWEQSYYMAQNRCNDKTRKGYKYYGGYGIKFLLTMNEIKALWFRDKAYLMKKPSIDRINTYGHYELKNCQFLEISDNCKNPRRKI